MGRETEKGKEGDEAEKRSKEEEFTLANAHYWNPDSHSLFWTIIWE